jgi:hypothetical protein
MSLVVIAAAVSGRSRPSSPAWLMMLVVVAVFVGLRHKIGMDWNNYLQMASRVQGQGLVDALEVAEPGYASLLWLSTQLGLGVYGANAVGAAVFSIGLFRLCSKTPLPWVALATAMPMLVVVVSMSANRQTVAIGILLWLVSSWASLGFWRRVVLVMAAAMFHFSAAFFLLFTVLDLRMSRASKFALSLVAVSSAVAFLQLSGGAAYYDSVYVSGQSDAVYSPGAVLHVLLNGVPALFALGASRFRARLLPSDLYLQLAWLALALVPLSLVFSTASGRMSLYLFPVSMMVLGGLPTLLASGVQRAITRTAIAGTMLFVLWYWLSFANSSLAYLPYNNVLWMNINELHL